MTTNYNESTESLDNEVKINHVEIEIKLSIDY